MMKFKTISLYEWFKIAPGAFLMGFAVGTSLCNFAFSPLVFLFGFLIEIPALVAIKRHK